MRASKNFFASACFSAWVVVACAKRDDSHTPFQMAATSLGDSAAASQAPALRDAPDPYLDAALARAKSIGHTSYVLKLGMAGGLVAAYKPRSRLPLGDRRYKSEIAAYRLARALALDNVPRAIPRAFAATELAAAFSTAEGAAAFRRLALVDADGLVRGALIPWIERYEELPWQDPAWRARWEGWLTADRELPAGPDRSAARAISTMLAFDYLTANWDRWSGGNVARDGATGNVLFVDNDGAFYDPPPRAALTRQLALLQRVLRFSRGFVFRLRELDEAALREKIGEESPGTPLLTEHAIQAVATRRQELLALIDARLADAGEGATLVFE
ncbi:MAG: hypothetical protein M3O36_07735 [Myxococcota bacterium]|nr:hypothetical protein [Myxococcota bacterium]